MSSPGLPQNHCVFLWPAGRVPVIRPLPKAGPVRSGRLESKVSLIGRDGEAQMPRVNAVESRPHGRKGCWKRAGDVRGLALGTQGPGKKTGRGGEGEKGDPSEDGNGQGHSGPTGMDGTCGFVIVHGENIG